MEDLRGRVIGYIYKTFIAASPTLIVKKRSKKTNTNLVTNITALESQIKRLEKKISEFIVSNSSSPEFLFDPDVALDRAYQMQNNAAKNIEAMWTVFRYSDKLKAYFKETLNKGMPTTRLIDIRYNSIDDYLDHIEQSWERLWDETYKIHFVKNITHEAMVIDHNKEAALFHYPGKEYGCLFMRGVSPIFITAVRGEFDMFKKKSTLFPARESREFNKTFDREAVRRWLNEQGAT